MSSQLPDPKLIALAQRLLAIDDWSPADVHSDVLCAAQMIVPMIDHTILKPEATNAEVRTICDQAKRYPFASVCVHSYWLPVVAAELKNSDCKACCVIGFPSGMHTAAVKNNEAAIAVDAGAEELDMVWNLGAVKSGEWEAVAEDICAVIDAASDRAAVKVILESATLTDLELRRGCEIALRAGASFVKTSTGFHPSGGATEHAIRIMREVVGTHIGVKASGGVRELRTALKMIVAGANRIGTSSGVAIAEMK